MYIRVDDGKVIFATHVVRLDQPLEMDESNPDYDVQQEKVCFSQSETDAYTSKLTTKSLTYTTEILSWSQDVIQEASTRTYNSRSEAIDDLSAILNETLDDVKAKKIAELNKMCGQTIFAGFTSSALGISHTYPADEEAQRNFNINMNRFLSNPNMTTVSFKTLDVGYLEHTKDQFFQVFNDGCIYGEQQITKYNQLKFQVNDPTTTTNDQVKSISWDTLVATTFV